MRPKRFNEVIGQERAKEQINILRKSASKRNKPLPALLFSGKPGTGKTTISRIIGDESKYNYYSVNGSSISSQRDLVYFLKRIKYGDILFIDEIHSLNNKVQHFLYQIMEDFYYENKDGNRVYKVELPNFTIIGATTHVGLLNKPLRDRFKHVIEFEPYTLNELSTIVNKVAANVGIAFSKRCAKAIAKTCKGNPRNAISRAEWVRDWIFAQDGDKLSVCKTITPAKLENIIELQGVDKHGLNVYEKRYISLLKNGTSSLSTMVSRLGLTRENIINDIEPYLIEIGLVDIGSRGRTLNRDLYKKMY